MRVEAMTVKPGLEGRVVTSKKITERFRFSSFFIRQCREVIAIDLRACEEGLEVLKKIGGDGA